VTGGPFLVNVAELLRRGHEAGLVPGPVRVDFIEE